MRGLRRRVRRPAARGGLSRAATRALGLRRRGAFGALGAGAGNCPLLVRLEREKLHRAGGAARRGGRRSGAPDARRALLGRLRPSLAGGRLSRPGSRPDRRQYAAEPACALRTCRTGLICRRIGHPRQTTRGTNGNHADARGKNDPPRSQPGRPEDPRPGSGSSTKPRRAEGACQSRADCTRSP